MIRIVVGIGVMYMTTRYVVFLNIDYLVFIE